MSTITEGEETMTEQPVPSKRIPVTAIAVTVAAAALGIVGGVAWQHAEPAQPVTVAVSPPASGYTNGDTPIGTPQPGTLGEMLRGGSDDGGWPTRTTATNPREQKVGRAAGEWAQREQQRLNALFDARCVAAGGQVLLTAPPQCTVDLPPLPAVPAR